MKRITRFIFIALSVALVMSFNTNAFALFGKDKTEAEKQEEIQQEKADIRKVVN